MNFLIVEDDKNFSEFLSSALSKYGKPFVTDTLTGAQNLLQSYSFDCAIIDLKLGDEILGPRIALMAKRRGVGHVITVTNFESDHELVRLSYENGADDFVKKSNLKDNFEFFLKKVTTGRDLKKNVLRLTKTTYITKDKDLIKSLEDVCTSYAPFEPIFIGGESGVGKTQLGKCLKSLLALKGELIELNCAGLNDEIIKSELFGHEKGAFTGADKQTIGKIELAHEGILFLDEIGDMPLVTQEKLLKVIEEKEFTRVGGNKKIKSNFLLVTATLKNLEELVSIGKLRPDFYNRIKGKTIHIKPLRERPDDLNILINHFLSNSTRSVYLVPEAHEALMKYAWPGNIRELDKTINRLSDLKTGIVTLNDLSPAIRSGHTIIGNESYGELLTRKQIEFVQKSGSLIPLFEQLEREMLQFAYYELKGNKSKIAKKYSVSRTKIWKFFKETPMEHHQ
jgi:DNA-binding NtrC family response regulator